MYDEVVKTLNPTGGTLSVDDSVLDKPYSYSVALVGHFWSGKHHRSVTRHQPHHSLLHRHIRATHAGELQGI